MFRDTIPTVDLGSCEGLAQITRLYKLADFLLVEELRNVIVDAILKYLEEKKWGFNFYSLSVLREKNLRSTPLYKLVLRSSVRRFINAPEVFEEGAAEDIEFLDDKPELMMEILEGVRDYNKMPYGQVWKCHKCEFHEHEDSPICRN